MLNQSRCAWGLLVWGATLGGLQFNAEAQFNVGPSVEYGQLLRPSGMTSGDFNGDLDNDLATTADGFDRVVVFANAGDATFPAVTDFPLPSGSAPQDVIAGDLDGDLDIDLAVALRRDPDGAVRIMLNNGAGNFTLGASIPVGDRPRGLSIADIDGDHDLDLAVANRDGDSATILTNNGSGVFAAMTVATGGEPRQTAFGDFLGDASLEIAVTNHDDRTVSILAENNGSYAAVMTMPVSNNNRPDGITAADLNGDGLDDLAVAADNLATVFINNGAGFNGPFNYVTNGLNGSEIMAADLDCDGHLDLAVTNTDSQNLSLLRNNGNGTFAAGQLSGTGVGPEEATVAHLDNDRDLDLAVANVDSGNISVLVNRTCAALPGDFNGDGNLDCDDVDALVADIAAGNDTASFDLTGDGFVDQDDLNQWLADAGAFNLPSGNAYLVGDANLDGNVDASDFNTWNENKFTTIAAWCSGDFNADGRVDISDFNAWNANKFSSADATAVVPEPAALPMLVFATAAIPLLRRRKVTGRSLVARS